MTRLLSVARSSGAWPLSLIGIGLFSLIAVGCAGSLPPDLVGGGGTGGMGGGGGGTGGMTTTVPDVMCSDGMMATAKIVMSCGQTQICHDATAGSAGGLSLSDATKLAANLVDKKPIMGKSISCGMYPDPYLKKGSMPPTGLFLEKLKMMPACGSFMPFAKAVLPQADIDCLTMWSAGAVK